MVKKCDCDDWKENIPIIDAALSISITHGMSGLKKCANYCMYCGKKLKGSATK